MAFELAGRGSVARTMTQNQRAQHVGLFNGTGGTLHVTRALAQEGDPPAGTSRSSGGC